jgi:hypothetical protein
MRPEDVNPAWLSDVLGVPVAEATPERIGTGQVGMSVRYTLSFATEPPDGTPRTVVAKLPSDDETSRATGVALRNYEREVRFYQDMVDTVDICTPHCFHAEWDEGSGDFTLVLEDLAPAEQGDQMRGCTVAEATLALEELAALHAPRWDDPSLAELEWLGRRDEGTAAQLQGLYQMLWPGFLATYQPYLSSEQLELGERFGTVIGSWITAFSGPMTVTHGDYRLDNMMFATPAGGHPLAVVDWQSPGHGYAVSDLSYFLGAGLLPGERRAHEQALVAGYHASLRRRGVTDLSAGDLWHGYRLATFSGVIMAVVASMIVGHTERGEAMFAAMATRHLTHALDLDAIALVP